MKHLDGKKVAIGLVVSLALIITTLVLSFQRGQTLTGEIVVELPVPPAESVGAAGSTEVERVLVRRGFEQRGYLFLLRERAGVEVWRERRGLYGFQAGTTPVIVGDLILVRTRRSSGLHETHAFDLATGEFRWAGATPSPPLDATGAPGPTFVHEGVVTEVYEGDPGELIGVRLDDGSELYRQTLPIVPIVPNAGGAAVTLEGQRLRVSAREPGDPPLCFSQRSGASTDCAP